MVWHYVNSVEIKMYELIKKVLIYIEYCSVFDNAFIIIEIKIFVLSI